MYTALCRSKCASNGAVQCNDGLANGPRHQKKEDTHRAPPYVINSSCLFLLPFLPLSSSFLVACPTSFALIHPRSKPIFLSISVSPDISSYLSLISHFLFVSIFVFVSLCLSFVFSLCLSLCISSFAMPFVACLRFSVFPFVSFSITLALWSSSTRYSLVPSLSSLCIRVHVLLSDVNNPVFVSPLLFSCPLRRLSSFRLSLLLSLCA